jgi:hypothetical protein
MYQRHKKDRSVGFAIIELLLLVAVFAIAGGMVYVYFQNSAKTTQKSVVVDSTKSQTITDPVAPTAPAGTTSIITQLTAQDAQTEFSVDKAADSETQLNAISANSAASDVGGAFDASSF